VFNYQEQVGRVSVMLKTEFEESDKVIEKLIEVIDEVKKTDEQMGEKWETGVKDMILSREQRFRLFE